MSASTSQVLTNSSYVNKINYQGNKKAENFSRYGRMTHGINPVCPAKDIKCHTCGLQGHYARCCKSPAHKKKSVTSNFRDVNNKRFKHRVNFVEDASEDIESG
uniref:CCHC-type domain-containing protein n=1 Tax=Trichogramma kaykai TaxID=54128 RepID=A0ABD2W2N5_9HYME